MKGRTLVFISAAFLLNHFTVNPSLAGGEFYIISFIKAQIPKGGIIMWSGEIDSNGNPVIDQTPNPAWEICDGANGKPDLRSRFIVGAGGHYAPGNTGGAEEEVTLSLSQMPSHRHHVDASTTEEQVKHKHSYDDHYSAAVNKYIYLGGLISVELLQVLYTNDDHRNPDETKYSDQEGDALTSTSHKHTITTSTTQTGQGQPFYRVPPYYALAFIRYEGSTSTPSPETRMPKGGISLWSGPIDSDGNPIIDGKPNPAWQICDGTKGTPDLRSRFIVGAGSYYDLGDTGGSETVTLNTSNLPAHDHTFDTATQDTEVRHLHAMNDHVSTAATFWYGTGGLATDTAGWAITDLKDAETHSTQVSDDASTTHYHSFNSPTLASGNGESIDIMPPYYSLAYIMYMGDQAQ